jgi:hypothetical protein
MRNNAAPNKFAGKTPQKTKNTKRFRIFLQLPSPPLAIDGHEEAPSSERAF